jgi:hypothetical protein
MPDILLVVLNRVAKSVIDEMRGQHPEYVFSYEGKPISRMNNSAYSAAELQR